MSVGEGRGGVVFVQATRPLGAMLGPAPTREHRTPGRSGGGWGGLL